MWVCVCVCVCWSMHLKRCVCMRLCVNEREREWKRVCVCERERERVCVCVCVCVCLGCVVCVFGVCDFLLFIHGERWNPPLCVNSFGGRQMFVLLPGTNCWQI